MQPANFVAAGWCRMSFCFQLVASAFLNALVSMWGQVKEVMWPTDKRETRTDGRPEFQTRSRRLRLSRAEGSL